MSAVASEVLPPSSFNKAVVIGGSGIELGIVINVLAQMPADYSAPILLALHSVTISEKTAVLEALRKATKLPCDYAEDLQPIKAGRIHLAPPSKHMLVDGECLRVVFGPRENRHRPALDPLFRTAGLSLRERAIGVLLCGITGEAEDGLSGMHILRELGGTTIVPHLNGNIPLVPAILHPSSVFKRVPVDYRPHPQLLPKLLQQLIEQPNTLVS